MESATASETLASFVAECDVSVVEPSIVDKLKDHLLDTIGVACAGSADRETRPLSTVVQRWGGAPDATVIGLQLRLPAPKAAFLNALHARIHTFDDVYEVGPVHPGASVVAATLAAAEITQVSGRTLLSALLAGYESAARVSRALGAPHYAAGFHSTGTATPFGAAAAAARTWALDASKTAAAFGLAGDAAVGIRQYQIDGSMLDTALNGARGAEIGVAAAAFAMAGSSGPRGILDGRWGLLNVMSGESSSPLTRDLGRRWDFTETMLKPYASCRFTHGVVDALLRAMLDPRTIESIEIATFRTSVEVSDRPHPRDRMEAILSHQLAAALALLGRPITPDAFDEIDATVRDLASRVLVRHDPALDAAYPSRWPHRITVLLGSGERLALESDQPPAADRRQIRTKFEALAAPVLGASNVAAVIDAVDNLDHLSELQPLLRPLRCGLAKAA